MQALSSIADKIVVFTDGIGSSVKNWGQRLQLKKWTQWVAGKSPMPDKPQRVALASTAAAALVVVVVLVVGASMVFQSPTHHVPSTAQSSGSGSSDSSNSPDLSQFEGNSGNSGASSSGKSADTSSKGTHHAKPKGAHKHEGSRKTKVTTVRVKTTRSPRSNGRRGTPRHSSQSS
jgi:hypothetical protein